MLRTDGKGGSWGSARRGCGSMDWWAGCAVTTRDPDSGAVDLPTLHYLNLYRGAIRAEERLPFGVFAEVVTPGEVRVGDPVVPPPE